MIKYSYTLYIATLRDHAMSEERSEQWSRKLLLIKKNFFYETFNLTLNSTKGKLQNRMNCLINGYYMLL
jgi:hypothetical protein